MFEITFGFEIAALLTGFVFFKKINPVVYRLLVLVLFLTVVNEGFSKYAVYKTYRLDKRVFFNIFFLIQFVCISFIYAVLSGFQKQLLFILTAVTLTALFVLFQSGLTIISPDFITVISTGIILSGFYYLYFLYAQTGISSLKTNAVLFFTIGSIIVQFLLLLYINAKRIDSFKNDENWLSIFRVFNTLGNIIYYSLIIYSFICTSIYRRQVGT